MLKSHRLVVYSPSGMNAIRSSFFNRNEGNVGTCFESLGHAFFQLGSNPSIADLELATLEDN